MLPISGMATATFFPNDPNASRRQAIFHTMFFGAYGHVAIIALVGAVALDAEIEKFLGVGFLNAVALGFVWQHPIAAIGTSGIAPERVQELVWSALRVGFVQGARVIAVALLMLPQILYQPLGQISEWFAIAAVFATALWGCSEARDWYDDNAKALMEIDPRRFPNPKDRSMRAFLKKTGLQPFTS